MQTVGQLDEDHSYIFDDCEQQLAQCLDLLLMMGAILLGTLELVNHIHLGNAVHQ